MLLAEVVATSEVVAATPARNAKIDALAALLARCVPGEVEAVVGFLTGEPRQGRIGVGWATMAAARDLEPALADPNADDPLTVADLDRAIDVLRTTTGTGSVAARRHELGALLRRATAREAEFLTRLLTGELRQGALAGVMTDAVAHAAEVPPGAVRRAAMLGGNLGATASRALTGGGAALAEVGLDVLRPISPMLAASASTVGEALGHTGAASVEWKLDGMRVQAHRVGTEVRIFTRNLNDVTERLPEVVRGVRALPAHALVLDGEALGVDAAFFFDVLHVDGTDLLDRPLAERAEILTATVGEHRVPALQTDDAVAAAAFLAEALATGHEGVMVKALDSPYAAGRRGGAWRKVKPVRTLDLVVLAAEWGHGRRRGWLSNLHLGARDPESGELVMVGKTFKGLSDELLTWQTARLQEIAERTEGHVVFVRPELVVEIALDSAQASTRYPGGVALRFARVRAYRPDKSPGEADTITAVQSLLPG